MMGRHFDDEIALGGHCTGVTRWQQQVLAALALIRANHAHVLDKAEPRIIEKTEDARRQFDHQWGISLHLEIGQRIQGVGVAGQIQRSWLEQLLSDSDRVRRRADAGIANSHGI